MQLLRDAVNAVQRNLPALGILIGFAVAWNLAFRGLDFFVGNLDERAPIPSAGILFSLVKGLVFIALLAAVQSIVFSMMGRDIDRPLWKVADNKEAIRRFYPVWFTINLVALTLNMFAELASKDVSTRPLFFLFLMLIVCYSIVATPIGACIMFQGKFSWEHLSDALNPLVKQGQKTLAVLGLTFAQTLLVLYFMTAMPPPDPEAGFNVAMLGMTTAAAIINSYLECLVFAAVWIICIIDRNTYDEVDLDF